MIWMPERRLWMPFGASRGAIARALVSSSPPTINGSESLAGLTSGADPLVFSLASQTYTTGDFLLAFGATYNQTVSGAAGSTDDTYAEIEPGVASFLRSFSGTVVGGSLDSALNVDLAGGNRGVGGLITISGASGGVDISGNGSGADQSPVMPSVTTTVNNCLVIGIIQAIGSHNLTTLNGALPSGWTFLFSGRTLASDFPSSTTQCTAAVAYKTQASAGATGAATWSSGLGASMNWLAHTIALAP